MFAEIDFDICFNTVIIKTSRNSEKKFDFVLSAIKELNLLNYSEKT